MRRLRRLLSVVAGIGLLTTALTGSDLPAQAQAQPVVPQEVTPQATRYLNRVFTGLEATPGVVYRRTTDWLGFPVNLAMDIYEPAGDTVARRPAVVWMFGGGWAAGDRWQMQGYAQDSARRGYVGITIDYRIRLFAPSLDGAIDAYEDALAAVTWLRANAARYGIDPDAIVVGGISAGAVNAMNVLYRPPTSPAAGAVSISGLAFNAPTAGDPPAIMHHGTADNVVPYNSARQTCDGAVAAGNACRWFAYTGAGHEIGILQAGLVQDRSARSIYELVLRPRGYR